MVKVMSHLGATPDAGWNARPHALPPTGWHKCLPDGTHVHIRPINPQGASLELEFLHRLSPQMRSLRFLGLIVEPSADVARGLTDLDPAHAAGFAAVVSEDGRERQIGAAHFHANPAGDRCDCSVTVSDDWQKRGVGSSLMRLLVDAARARGIRYMRAFAPVRADRSHHLAMRLGFKRRLDPRDPPVVVYHLDL